MATTSEAARFRHISPAEFFAKYKEIAGFGNPSRAMYQTVRELVENALDATDSHGILPNIKIIISRPASSTSSNHYTITVEDNGIGIPPQHVPNAFGKVLFSSKYVQRQTRGMFGLGVKAAIIYAQKTTGEPVEVVTSTIGSKRIYYFKIKIDLAKNEPIIVERGSWRKSREWHGTIASLTIEGDWGRSARRLIIEYIKRTAVVTPYANIVFVTPDKQVYFFKRTINKLPPPPKEVKPHPRGIDLTFIKDLIKSTKKDTVKDMLVKNLQGVGDKIAEDALRLAGIDPNKSPHKLSDDEIKRLVAVLRGIDPDYLYRLQGSVGEKTVAEAISENIVGIKYEQAIAAAKEAGIDPQRLYAELSEEEIDSLAKALKRFYPRYKAPSSESLSPLGEEIIIEGLKRIYHPEFVAATTRRPSAYQGHPFIVEVGIAYGGKIPSRNRPQLLRYANKIPLLRESSDDISWKVVMGLSSRRAAAEIDKDKAMREFWSQYGVEFPAPLVVLTHICSTKIPFTGVGKESIADVPEIERELRLGLMDVARKLKRYLTQKKLEAEKKRRVIVLAKYIPEVTRSLTIIAKDIFGNGIEEKLRNKLIELAAHRIGIEQEEVKEIVDSVETGV